jgi:hypothetical protein
VQSGGIVRGKMAATGKGLWLAIGACMLKLLRGVDVSELGGGP